MDNEDEFILFGYFILFLILTQGHFFITFREKKRAEGRERNTADREKHWLVASHMCPDRGLNPQPRYVPRLGIEPASFQLWDDAPTNWAVLARAWLLKLVLSRKENS